MSESQQLLELIDRSVVEHGGDLGGWTRLVGDTLQLFDSRVTLRAEIKDPVSSQAKAVHAHVSATLHEYEDEILDACLYGAGDNLKALQEASMIWITCVAGPIKSFLDRKPVCMSSQAGVAGGDPSKGYSRGNYGLPGLRAYVGPSFARGFDNESVQMMLDDTKPWFRFASESAAPRRIHLAKVTIASNGEKGWSRYLEIDGHEVSHHDPRARVIASELQETMEREDFRSLCLYNAESNAIMKAMEAEGEKLDLTQIKMYPCVVPDRGASEQTMSVALSKLDDLAGRNKSPEKKSRWKFW